jgi:hypothetical protein
MGTANSPKRNCARLVRQAAAVLAAPVAPVALAVLTVKIVKVAPVAKDGRRVLTGNNPGNIKIGPAAS